MTAKVQKVQGREVLDSRGFPTVEATVQLENGIKATACVPSGASTGTHEALELRDGGERYLGKGVQKAVENLNTVIAPALKGRSVESLKETDTLILSLDETENKAKLGANAILAASLACAHVSAQNEKLSLAEWIHRQCADLSYKTEMKLPVPLMNVINGGAHADNGLDIQEFMIVPHGFSEFREALRAGAEIFHHLKKILSSRSLTTAVGDEGGFAPRLDGNEAALKVLMEAIEKAGYRPAEQVSLALDVASTEFYSEGYYHFRDAQLGKTSSDELIEYYAKLSETYPIISIEDGMSEDDWEAWAALNKNLGSQVQLVGDDLYVTQSKRLQKGIEAQSSNAILIKLNQVGSLLETLETMKLANENHIRSVVSHRSGETEDTSLADLVVGTGAGQVKTGSLSRSDRVAKYNQLLRLEGELACPFATVPGTKG